MVFLKRITIVFLFFAMLINAAFCQENRLNSAVKDGKNSTKHYVAKFKNLDLKHKDKIYKWSKKNGYKVIDIFTNQKERFGGNNITYINKVIFISEFDLYLKKAKTRNASFQNMEKFLDKFHQSEEADEVSHKLAKNIDLVATTKKYINRYPQYKNLFLDRAYEIANTGNLDDKKSFLSYYPDHQNIDQIQIGIDNELKRIEERRIAAELEEKRRIAEAKRIEKENFDVVIASDDKENLQSFLNTYPNSTYSKEVNNRIAIIEEEESKRKYEAELKEENNRKERIKKATPGDRLCYSERWTSTKSGGWFFSDTTTKYTMSIICFVERVEGNKYQIRVGNVSSSNDKHYGTPNINGVDVHDGDVLWIKPLGDRNWQSCD